MEKTISMLFLLVGLLLLISCKQTSSQAESRQEQIERDERVLVSRQENVKYKLSVLFYKDPAHKGSNFDTQKDLPNVMVFRDDNNNEEFRTVELSDGIAISDANQEVWSPDKEYLLLDCDYSEKLCVYKASEARARLAQGNTLSAEDAFDFVGPIVFTEIDRPHQGVKKYCELRFKKWIGDNAFVFKVRAVESKSGLSTFKYDIAQQNIYSGKGDWNDELQWDYSFEAANKNGKLKFIRSKPASAF